MINAIVGTKITQTQTFNSNDMRIPVTLISAGPCVVVDIKTKDKHGYNAIQLGFGVSRISLLTKAELGNIKKAGLDKNPPRFLREIRINTDLKRISTDKNVSGNPLLISENLPKVGDVIKAIDIFKVGDLIRVTGISKGKGFQGVVKRHHFRGGPRTHGQSDRERAPGAIGSTTTPGRVYKGKRMAGRMGSDKVTIKNLKVVAVDAQKNLLTISGLIPGGRNNLIMIQKMESS